MESIVSSGTLAELIEAGKDVLEGKAPRGIGFFPQEKATWDRKQREQARKQRSQRRRQGPQGNPADFFDPDTDPDLTPAEREKLRKDRHQRQQRERDPETRKPRKGFFD